MLTDICAKVCLSNAACPYAFSDVVYRRTASSTSGVPDAECGTSQIAGRSDVIPGDIAEISSYLKLVRMIYGHAAQTRVSFISDFKCRLHGR